MRPFLWRIVICLTPLVLAGWVTTVAVARYYRGEPGGFKLGVDLVGGTIREGSHVFRRLQTGLVQTYALLMLFGVFVFVSIYLIVR